MALQIAMMAPLRYNSTLPLSLSVLIAEISFCFSSQVYVVYLGSKNSYSPDVILSQNHQMLVAVHGGSVEKARLSHVYSYRHGFRGFAAKLTDEQASFGNVQNAGNGFGLSKFEKKSTYYSFMGFHGPHEQRINGNARLFY